MNDSKLERALDAVARQQPQGDASALATAALAELQAHPKPRRWWLEAAGLTGLNGALMGTFLVAFPSAEDAERATLFAGTAVILLGLLLGGLLLAVRPGAQRGALVMGGLALLACVTTLVGATGARAELPLMAGTGCARFELLVSALPMLGALWVLRRFAFDARRALLAGASVGAVGLVTLHVHCPISTVGHLLLFHLVPWVLVIGLTLLLRRLVRSWSFAP